MAKLIHMAKIDPGHLLYLRQVGEKDFRWYQEGDEAENETPVRAQSIEEALRLAARHWKWDAFRTVVCGFKFTLPERDEHGYNALFFELVAALGTINGIFFDEEFGHFCQIKQIPKEARELYKSLKQQNKL